MSGGGRTAGQQREMARDLPGLPSAETIGLNFARSVGIEGTDAAALAALRALPAERIVSGLNLASLFAPPSGPPTYSGPFTDGVTLTGSVEAMFDRGGQAPVPVMVGATNSIQPPSMAISAVATRRGARAVTPLAGPSARISRSIASIIRE